LKQSTHVQIEFSKYSVIIVPFLCIYAALRSGGKRSKTWTLLFRNLLILRMHQSSLSQSIIKASRRFRINSILGLGLNDYLQIVKNPMDLGSVSDNLTSGRYTTVEECLNEIQLVWNNCKLYNTEGSVSL